MKYFKYFTSRLKGNMRHNIWSWSPFIGKLPNFYPNNKDKEIWNIFEIFHQRKSKYFRRNIWLCMQWVWMPACMHTYTSAFDVQTCSCTPMLCMAPETAAEALGKNRAWCAVGGDASARERCVGRQTRCACGVRWHVCSERTKCSEGTYLEGRCVACCSSAPARGIDLCLQVLIVRTALNFPSYKLLILSAVSHFISP